MAHDHTIQKASSGVCKYYFIPDLQRTFSRGFTDYMFRGNRNKIASADTPKSIGKPVARVLLQDKFGIRIEAIENLHNGDGLCFFNPQGELDGFRVNKVEGQHIFILSLLYISDQGPCCFATMTNGLNGNWHKHHAKGVFYVP